MDAFIFTQKYNTLGTDYMVSLGNPKRCNATQRTPNGTEATHICDAVGFHQAARTLRRIHEIPQPIVEFDNGLNDEIPRHRRRHEVLAALNQVPDASLDLVAYFGHGTQTSLESAGIGPEVFMQFKDLIERKCRPNATIVLYACLTGAAHGFAEKLGGMINPALNIWVYGHIGPGHYAQLGMFRKYPGGQRLSRQYEDRLCLSFWRHERAAQTH